MEDTAAAGVGEDGAGDMVWLQLREPRQAAPRMAEATVFCSPPKTTSPDRVPAVMMLVTEGWRGREASQVREGHNVAWPACKRPPIPLSALLNQVARYCSARVVLRPS